MKKIDYIIYYEHITRELDANKLLKLQLDKKGLRGVILPIHFNVYVNILKYQPKIIILPYLYKFEDSFIAKNMKQFNKSLIIANLHSEQIGNNQNQEELLPLDEGSKAAYHFVWGDFFEEFLVNAGVNYKLIFKCGSIRNDLLHKYNSPILNSKKVIVPTSFSMTFVSQDYIESSIKKRDSKREEILESIGFATKSRDKFFQIIHETSLLLKDYEFILRPHPYVDLKEYNSKYLEVNEINEMPSNIKIERIGSIAEAMSTCNYVIVWNSTSCLEANIMGKSVFQLAPYKFNEFENMKYMDYIQKGSSTTELINFLEGNTYQDKQLDEYVCFVYGTSDGKASERISDRVEYLIKDYKYEFVYTFKNLLNAIKILFKAITIDTSKHILLKLNLLDKIKPRFRGIIEDNVEII